MSSTEPNSEYLSEPAGQALLDIARRAVGQAAKHLEREPPQLATLPEAIQGELALPRATFVTLNVDGVLRGCLGTLEARRAVADDVSGNAYRAAIFDTRFPPIAQEELPALDLHISVLTPLTPMEFDSYDNLKSQVRPGIDGLLVQSGDRRGTFLPAVWEKTEGVDHFLKLLWRKAGFAPGEWPDDLKVFRYEAQSF